MRLVIGSRADWRRIASGYGWLREGREEAEAILAARPKGASQRRVALEPAAHLLLNCGAEVWSCPS